MPNHVQNNITIYGPSATLEAIMCFVRTDDDIFDFEKIIPMPEAFKDLSEGGTTIDGKQYRMWRRVDDKDVGIEPDEIEEWKAKYGAAGWYEWSIKYWGTKWNAYDVDDPILTSRTLRYQFDTAWSSPEPVLQALADRFGVKIKVAVSGEVDEPYSYELEGEPVATN